MVDKLKRIFEIDVIKYIYLNYFSKQIIKDKGTKIYPYRGTKIELHKDARIILHSDLKFCTHKIKGSKAEAYCLLYENSKLEINGVADIAYGCMIQAHRNASIKIGQSHINSYTTLIADKNISIGNEVMISRGVVIFDSDFHPVLDENGRRTNPPEDVVLEDHVWIGVKATILRGSVIKKGAAVGANALITGTVKERALMSTIPARGFGYIEWRER